MNKSKKTEKGRRISAQVLWQGCAILLVATALGILVNHFRPDRLLLMEKSSQQDSASLDMLGKMTISFEEAQNLFFSRSAVFIDARPPELYRRGHIPRALNLPWESWEENLTAVISNIPHQDATVIVYCDKESSELSINVALLLNDLAQQNARYLINGWTQWKQNHLPTEAEPSFPTS